MVLTLSRTKTEQVAAELFTRSANAVVSEYEAGLDAAPVEIEVHPDSSLKVKTSNLSTYTRILAGVVGSVVLLSPLMLLPGLIVFVLPAEIYTVGWIYDRIIELQRGRVVSNPEGSTTGTVTLDEMKDKANLSALRYKGALLEPLK